MNYPIIIIFTLPWLYFLAGVVVFHEVRHEIVTKHKHLFENIPRENPDYSIFDIFFAAAEIYFEIVPPFISSIFCWPRFLKIKIKTGKWSVS